MSGADWYLALFCLGAGAGIGLFWLTPAGRAALREPGPAMRFHVAAELVTATALLTAGVALIVDGDARWVPAVGGLSLGMLVYALVGSPGLWLARGDTRTTRLLMLTWLGAIPAVVLLILR